MAILGYEETNSKIDYPFVDGVLSASTPYLTPDIFVDFQFVDFTNIVKSVYISRVTNTVSGNIVFYFNNTDTAALLGTLTVAAANAVNHIGNTSASFVSTSTSDYAIKVVFGPGIASIIANNFDSTYTAAETTFSPNTVVLTHPVVEEIIVNNNYPATTVHTYSPSDNVLLSPGSNIDTSLVNGDLSIAVFQNAGTGLYNPCTSGPITNVVTINQLAPNSNGNFFVGTDNCYSEHVLNQSDLTVYATNLATYTTNGIPFIAGHTFLIQNNCSAKCPPESLNALADYINRLRDGIQEVYEIAEQPDQTAGHAAVTTSGSFELTASSFSSVESGASGFIKYLHEGRAITFVYPSGLSQLTSIVTVLSSSQVMLADAINTTTLTGTTSFAVDDLGIYNKLNYAITTYNTTVADTLNVPYGQIIYTTSEGVNELSEYGTYLSVVAAIYNPTGSAVNFSANFAPSSELELEANTYKLRQDGVVTISPSFPVSLACKDYATVEGVFFIPCGPNSGTLDVSITIGGIAIENGTKTISVTSTTCASASSGDVVEVATANYGSTFTHHAYGTSGTLAVNATTLPPWINPVTGIDTTITPTSTNFTGTPSDTTNTSYLVASTIFDGSNTIQYDLIINSIGLPVVTSASVTAYVGTAFVYPTTGAIATNSPTYTATGLTGSGLTIDSATGVISGTPLATSVGSIPVGITATNSAGSATGTITITVAYAPPVIYSTLSQNLSVGVPFTYQILATNAPSGSTYSATALSGSGLSIDTSTGIISGTPVASGTISSLIGVTAPGGSNSKTLNLAILLFPPVITSSGTTTASVGTPFTFTITASNAPTSFLTVTGLPAGITQSGAVLSGTPTVGGTFNVTVAASNAAGVGSGLLTIFVSSTVPEITSPLSISANQGVPFSYQIIATNSPTSYSQAGIPGTLSLNTSTGLITGTIATSGLTSFSISAINGTGADTETLNINVSPVGTPTITSSATPNFLQGVAGSYQITGTNYPTSFSITSGTLPSGLTLNTATGIISGIAALGGSTTTNYSITVGATNSIPSTGTLPIVLTVTAQVPIIVSSNTYIVKSGSTMTYTLIGSNNPTSYGATGLPSWLSRSGTIISGTAPGPSGTDGVSTGTTTFSSSSYSFSGLAAGTPISISGQGTFHVVSASTHSVVLNAATTSGSGLTFYVGTSMTVQATNSVGTGSLTVSIIID